MNIHFIPQSVLWYIHSLFHSEYSTECELCVPFPFTMSSLFLKIIQQLLTSSFLSSSHFCPLPYLSSITCSRRQFLHKMWPIQLAFLCFIICRIFLSSLTVCNSSSFFTQSAQMIFSIPLSSTTFQNFPSISNWLFRALKFQRHTKPCSISSTLLISSLHQPSFLMNRVFCYLNAVFAMAILNLILCVHLASLVIMLPMWLQYSTISGCFCSIIICNGDGCLKILIALVFSILISVQY